MGVDHGTINFECTDDNIQWDTLQLSTSRLESAYQEFKAFVPSHENLQKFLKLLKRHGLEPEQKPRQRSVLQTSKEEPKTTRTRIKNDSCKKTK